MGQLGGTSAFFLSLYIQLCTIMALHGAALHLCPSDSTLGRTVDRVFWILDCLCGSILLGVVAILSTGRILGKIQTVLLFDRKVASEFRNAEAARLFAQAARQGPGGYVEADGAAAGADASALSQATKAASAQSGEQGAAGWARGVGWMGGGAGAQGGDGKAATWGGPGRSAPTAPQRGPPAR